MDSLVSVIVTCYNHEAYIEQCLESIFEQTYRNIELLVYNDGSSDSSGQLIEKTLEKSPFARTHYTCHENMGLVPTRNKGLADFTGEFVLFVDSDNFLEPNYVEEMLRVLREEELDIAYPALVDPASKRVLVPARHFDLADLFVNNYIDSCSLVRASIIGEVQYDLYLNYKKLEDYDFFLHLILHKGAKAGPAQQTHLNYRVLDNSMSDRTNIVKYYSVYTYVLNKYYELEPDLAEKALKTNAQYILSDNMMANQIIKVYFQHEGEFSNDYSLDLPLKEKDSITFTIDQDARVLRVDLSEVPSYYNLVRLTTGPYQTEVVPISTNGIQLDASFLFHKEDPQIIYDISSFDEREFTLNYEVHNLYNIKEEDYIARVLAKQIDGLKKNAISRDHYYGVIQQWKQRFSQVSQELAQLQDQHNRVIGSRRWIIPTKIINLIRRQK